MRRRRVTVNPCSCTRPISAARMGPPLSHAKANWALDPGPCFVLEGNLTPVVLALWEVCGSRESSVQCAVCSVQGAGKLNLNCWATLSLSDEPSVLSASPKGAALGLGLCTLEQAFSCASPAQTESRPSSAHLTVDCAKADRRLSVTTCAWRVGGSPDRRGAVEELATGAGEPLRPSRCPFSMRPVGSLPT